MSSPAVSAPASPLTGQWGGDRLQLVVDEQGARVEGDCLSGAIVGPITVGSDGRFSARGSFTAQAGGPQGIDGSQRDGARYSGQLRGGSLTLSILPAGAATPRVFHLLEGARVKLMRCL